MTYGPARISMEHPDYWMEEMIQDELGLVSPEHDAEHDAMMKHWNINFRNIVPLNGKNRFHHLALHVRYWKETNQRLEWVNKFERLHGSVNNIELPVIPEE